MLLFSAGLVSGQSRERTLRGNVVDEKNEAFPLVNVFLLQAADSVMVKGMAADTDGQYAFPGIGDGDFLIMASMVGFEKVYSNPFNFKGGVHQVPILRMIPEIQELSEVKVVAQKPFIEQEVDRTVINVENSIVAAGSTALEVLERSPGVTVDQQNDRLKLRGKEGIIVQIDGKQSYLSESELVNLLRNTPSDNIEKIELITNPSAKYDAAGNSGIINIKFKKNKNFGTNGNLSVGAGMASRNKPRANGMLTLNHKEGKLSWTATGNGFRGEGFNQQVIRRVIPFEGQNTTINSVSDSDWKAYYYSFRVGADYQATDKTTVGVLFSGFGNKWSNPLRFTEAELLNHDNSLQQSYTTSIQASNRMQNFSGNANLKHEFTGKGKELTFDVDYVQYDSKGYNFMDTRYVVPEGETALPDDIFRNNMPSKIHIGVAKLDYTQPVGKGKFEAGLKSSYVQADNNMVFETLSDQWWIDPSRTNRFKYTENINAAYLNFNNQLTAKTKYQLGIRAEHTHSIGNSVTLATIRDRNYVNFFPSVFLSHDLDSSNVLNLSYSYRIDRPNYQSLNPFEYYLDPYTFGRGNPHLRPQYTHSFQLVHVFKSFLNTTLAYSRIKDVIAQEVPHQIAEENKTYMTPDNLDHQNFLSLTLSAPLPVTKWWTFQLNATGTYNEYKTYYRNKLYDMSLLTYNLYGNNTIKLPDDWSVEAGGWLNGPGLYGMLAMKTQGALNFGVQKSFMEKKASLKLNIQDPFWTNRFRGGTQFEDIDLTIRSLWPSRQVRLTFSYRFGNQNVKTRQRNTGSDDLQQRVNTQN